MFNPAAALQSTPLAAQQQQAVIAIYNAATPATIEQSHDALDSLLGGDFDLFETVCVALKWA